MTRKQARLPLEQPIWSERIADALGVNVHMSFRTTVYGNTAAVVDLVKALGARHIRDHMVPANGAQQWGFAQLRAAGIKTHVTLGSIGQTPMSAGDMDALLAPIVEHPRRYWSVANVNEPQSAEGWVSRVRDHQKLIHDRLTALGLRGRVHTVGPALQDTSPTLDQDYAALAATDISRWTDFGDYHRYPLSGSTGPRPTPASLQDDRISMAEAAYGPQVFCTEGGFNTGVDLPVGVGGSPIPDDVFEVYAPRLWFELVERRVKRIFMYELLNDPDDPPSTWEAWFGLVNVPGDALTSPDRWTTKPAFTALSHLAGQLDDRNHRYHVDHNPYVPSPIRLQVNPEAPDVRHLVVGKHDGSASVYLWRDAPIWDKTTRTRLSVPVVDVHIERPERSWVVPVGPQIVSLPVKGPNVVAQPAPHHHKTSHHQKASQR